MRLASPTSKTTFRIKLAPFDILWATLAPIIALALRDPGLLDLSDFPSSVPAAYQYAFVTLACAIPSFLIFRVSDGLSRFFSVHDVLAVSGAAAASVASSSVIVFVFARLDGVPRSTPLIYGLVLSGGLIFGRTVARVFYKELLAERENVKQNVSLPNIRRVILIGVDRFAAVAIKLIDYQRPRTTQVVAALDPRQEFVGRTINGVKIVGLVQVLEAVISEYALHGIDVDEVWLSDETAFEANDVIDQLREQCGSERLRFLRISEALNLAPQCGSLLNASQASSDAPMCLGDYHKLKRIFDFIMAATILVAISPLALIAACLTLFDVGAPVLFWQLRVGRHGRKFLLYKFRTYRAPYDRDGVRIPDDQRLSKLGRMIRAVRLDEIPQLLNVLVGDMSLIGPRPLLPQDQPSDPRIRLVVRPGITGWAQINGGTIVTPEEKDALDVWYVRHASFWLDLKIIAGTILFALNGEKMNHAALERATHWRERNIGLSNASLEREDSLEGSAESVR